MVVTSIIPSSSSLGSLCCFFPPSGRQEEFPHLFVGSSRYVSTEGSQVLLSSPSVGPAQCGLQPLSLWAWETILGLSSTHFLGNRPPLTSEPRGVFCFRASEIRSATWLLCIWLWELRVLLPVLGQLWLFNYFRTPASWGIFHHTYGR